MGFLSDKMQRRCPILMITSAITAICLYITFHYPELTLNQLFTTAFITGICCGAHPLCFALGKENNPSHLAGTAVAVTNMFIMLGGMIFPPIIGKLLDMHAQVQLANGLPVYMASDYTFALNIVPIGIVFGTFLTIFLKETYCGARAPAASADNEPVMNNGSIVLDA